MTGPKTNEREGTRAVLRHARISPYKVREVLNLIRGKPVHEAEDILRFSDRDAAIVVGKVLHSAVANAENNDELDSEELYVSACFADEGTTIKRWRPRARGRATRIRKRTSHITVIVSRLPLDQLERLQARRRAERLAQRARRVAGARRSEGDTRNRADRRRGVQVADVEDEHDHDHEHDEAEEGEEAVSSTEAEAGDDGTETEAGGEPEAGTETSEAAAVEDEAEGGAEPESEPSGREAGSGEETTDEAENDAPAGAAAKDEGEED
jgi:large subunit ribosomal protein L22